MSVRQTGVVWKLHKVMKLKQNHLLLLLCLAEHAKDDGFCFPSINTLAKEMHMDTRTVKRSLSSIKKEHADLLEVKSGGGRFSNHYRLTLPKPLLEEWDLEHINYKREGAQNPSGRVRKNYYSQFSKEEIKTMEEEIGEALGRLKELQPQEDTLLPGIQIEMQNGKMKYTI